MSLDLWTYGWHRANHVIPFLWRFHRTHHSDPLMDVSTAVRFHVGEVAISSLVRLPLILLIGLPLGSPADLRHAFCESPRSSTTPTLIFPADPTPLLRLLIVSPDMHKIHHSQQPVEMDSNYASVPLRLGPPVSVLPRASGQIETAIWSCGVKRKYSAAAVTFAAHSASATPPWRLGSAPKKVSSVKPIDQSPLFDHPLDEPTEFRPQELLDAVRALNSSIPARIPSICVLDFDGDLVDALEAAALTTKSESWALFSHRDAGTRTSAGIEVGIVGRTIGGPYSVLIAEQMAVSGAEVIVGLSSAGRVSNELALPSLVVPTKALRDEGTSTHYVEPGRYVNAPEPLAGVLAEELVGAGLPVTRGAVWTTDAPYRETASQILNHANEGILAVEMQAASLFRVCSGATSSNRRSCARDKRDRQRPRKTSTRALTMRGSRF